MVSVYRAVGVIFKCQVVTRHVLQGRKETIKFNFRSANTTLNQYKTSIEAVQFSQQKTSPTVVEFFIRKMFPVLPTIQCTFCCRICFFKVSLYRAIDVPFKCHVQ